jgi:FAD/FMN-containing dehydrogenase
MELSLEALKKDFAGDIAEDSATRDAKSTDTSLFFVRPRAVVFPKNIDDVKKLVTFASQHNDVTLTARSAGTGMDGGALTEGVVVDFSKYFTNLGDVMVSENGTATITTQPGVFYRDFEKRTLSAGYLMPSYPASRELCMLGGMVSNNAGGELTLRYGKVENFVTKLNVVLGDGNEYTLEPLSGDALHKKLLQGDFEGDVYRQMFTLIKDNYDVLQTARPKVSKNSAGYYLWNVYDKEKDTFDLTKLFVGSQGTLGLVTNATLSLIHPSKYSQMVIIFLDSLKNIGDIVRVVLAHSPTTFESYDDKTLKLALRFFWEFIKRLGMRNLFVLAWHSLGEAMSILGHGLPKLVLQITFDGDNHKELLRKAEELVVNLRKFNLRYVEVIKNAHEMDEYWLIRRESFNLLRHKVKGMKTAPFIDDIVVPPSVLPEFFPKLYAILAKYESFMIHNIAGHIGNGNFHIIPLMDLTKEKNRAVIPEIAKQVYDLVFAYGGSCTGEHNDGIIRTPFLKQQYGEKVYALFEHTKKIFDPKGIFNPGKKVPTAHGVHGEPDGTLEYAMNHIKKGN